MREIFKATIIRFKYAIPCMVVIAMISGFSGNTTDNKPDNVFEATLMYDDDNMHFSGTSTYTSMPGMVSFYLEGSEPVTCSIHILKLSEEGLKKDKYLAISEEVPYSGVVCGVPYPDDNDGNNESISRERISSVSGEVIIEEVSQIYVSGSFDITLTGNKSDTKFRLLGQFTSYPKM